MERVMGEIKINKKLIAVVAGAMLAIACLVPCLAHAAGFPGVDYPASPSQGSATTQSNLKIDDTQLSFTAPSVINFAMDGAGDFIYPDAGVAKITNNSQMGIKVANFAITSDAVATGVAASAFDAATGNNVYKLKITPNSKTAIDFAVSQSSLTSDWVMGKTGTESDKLLLSFSDGKMKNIADGIWGATDGHHLQNCVWTVSAAIS